MQDRRQSMRDRVLYGATAALGENMAKRDCVVRNISEQGAGIEFRNILNPPEGEMSLTIAKKGHLYLARVIWSRDNVAGVAFSDERPVERPDSELQAQLRFSERKKRQLQRRIKLLMGEG